MILRLRLVLGLLVFYGIEWSKADNCFALAGAKGQYWMFCTGQMDFATSNTTCYSGNFMRLASVNDDSQLDLTNVLQILKLQSSAANQVQNFYQLIASSIDALLNQHYSFFDHLDSFLINQYTTAYSNMVNTFNSFTATLSDPSQQDQVVSLSTINLNNLVTQCSYLRGVIVSLKTATRNNFQSIFSSLENSCSTSMSSVNSAGDSSALQTALSNYQSALNTPVNLVSSTQSQFSSNIGTFQAQMNTVNTNLTGTANGITQTNSAFNSLQNSISSVIQAFYSSFNSEYDYLQSENTKATPACFNRLTAAKNQLSSNAVL